MSELRLPTEADWIHQAHVDLESLWDRAVFRLHEAYDVRVRPGWRLELHDQPWAEIWLIRRGHCTLRLGEDEAVAGPGQLAVLRPGRARSSANETNEELSLVGFGCSLRLSGVVDLLSELDLPLVVDAPAAETVALVREVVRGAHGQGVDRFLRARAQAQLALAEIVAAAGIDLTEGVQDPVAGGVPRSLLLRPEVRAVLDTIAARFAEPLDLGRLAAPSHLSPKHAARVFREALGITPMAYLRRYRLLRAAELLITTGRPVTRIAHDCGFTDSAHFARAFRDQFGVTAGQFRDHGRSFRSTVPSSGTSSADA